MSLVHSVVGSFVNICWAKYPKHSRFTRTTNRKLHIANRMVTWLKFKMTVWRRFAISECPIVSKVLIRYCSLSQFCILSLFYALYIWGMWGIQIRMETFVARSVARSKMRGEQHVANAERKPIAGVCVAESLVRGSGAKPPKAELKVSSTMACTILCINRNAVWNCGACDVPCAK